MLKALTAIILVVGIVFIILGAVIGNTPLAIVGDVMVVGGVLMSLFLRRLTSPRSGSGSEG